MKFLEKIQSALQVISKPYKSVYYVQEPKEVIYKTINEPLCFTSLEKDGGISFINPSNSPITLYKSTDYDPHTKYGTWTEFDAQDVIKLNINEKVYIKGDNPDGLTKSDSTTDKILFYIIKKTECSGNIMSLLGPHITEIPCAYCFRELFANTKLTSAPELPAQVLKDNCYKSMFSSCTELITPPELPAKQLAPYCYEKMFYKCKSLVETQTILPAEILANNCYSSMFELCTNLKKVFYILPAKQLAPYCYSSMFTECTTMRVAPVLPAETLEHRCYFYMFNGCSNLQYIKADFLNIPLNSNTSNIGLWVAGVAATGTFEKNSNATLNVIGQNGVPSGWTIK